MPINTKIEPPTHLENLRFTVKDAALLLGIAKTTIQDDMRKRILVPRETQVNKTDPKGSRLDIPDLTFVSCCRTLRGTFKISLEDIAAALRAAVRVQLFKPIAEKLIDLKVVRSREDIVNLWADMTALKQRWFQKQMEGHGFNCVIICLAFDAPPLKKSPFWQSLLIPHESVGGWFDAAVGQQKLVEPDNSVAENISIMDFVVVDVLPHYKAVLEVINR
jgi:hypothetical protein